MSKAPQFHYERDIDPDEGTVLFFEKKYERYMYNKERRMKKKIYDMKYKKKEFEELKNEHMIKIREDKEVQRKTAPIINIIKKNYLRANSANLNNNMSQFESNLYSLNSTKKENETNTSENFGQDGMKN